MISSPPSVSSSTTLEDGEFEIEDILDIKQKGKRVFYLVKWKGYDMSQNTWEPEQNLTHLNLFIKKMEQMKSNFMKNNKAKATKKTISKSKEQNNKREDFINSINPPQTPKQSNTIKTRNKILKKTLRKLDNLKKQVAATPMEIRTRRRDTQKETPIDKIQPKVDEKSKKRVSERVRNVQSVDTTDSSELNNKKQDSPVKEIPPVTRSKANKIELPDTAKPSKDVEDLTIIQNKSVEENTKNVKQTELPIDVTDMFTVRVNGDRIEYLVTLQNGPPKWIDEAQVRTHVKHLIPKMKDFKDFLYRKGPQSEEKQNQVIVKNLHNVSNMLFVSVGHDIGHKEFLSLYPAQVVQVLYPQPFINFLLEKLRFYE